MKESDIELDGVEYGEKRAWAVYKWATPGSTGTLDRLFLNKGIAFAIEYKAPGKKATPKQRKEAERLKSKGIVCRCIDNIEDSRAFINIMTWIVEGSFKRGEMAEAAYELSQDISSFDP